MMILLRAIKVRLLSLNKNLITVLALVFSANTGFSQINLVPNPSFEILYHCPTDGSQIDSLLAWSTLKSGGGGDPDAFNVCAPPVFVGVPKNLNSYQLTHSGNGYAGIDVASSASPNTRREYIQSKLVSKLQTGHQYCVRFYTSLSNQSTSFVMPLGVYFDSGLVSTPLPRGLANVMPQVYNTGVQLSDTVNWMKVEGSFTATGIETYITLGDFFTDANSSIGFFTSSPPASWGNYYYIDDVSVIDIATPVYAGNDTTIISGDSVFVGRPPEVGLNEDCIWFVNNIPKDTVAGLWVKPTVNTTYVLQQSICGTVTYDTVKINISGVGINEIKKDNSLSIYPNPTTNQFVISLNTKDKVDKIEVTIKNVTGKIISNSILNCSNNQVLYDKNLEEGVYFVTTKIIGSNKTNTSKLVIIK